MPRLIDPCHPQAAFDWADAWPLPQHTETLRVTEAAGRVLATSPVATRDHPPTTRAACDGYALRAADTLGASDYSPLPLELSPAPERVGRGQLLPVDDGDPLPEGADAVLPLDQADPAGRLLEVATGLAPGDGVEHAGQECRTGDALLTPDRRLRPQDLARLALAGIETVAVRRRPRVRLLLAGRWERDADGPMLAALIGRDGGEVIDQRVTADPAGLTPALLQADADLILVAGGTGLAARDCAVAALRAVGQVDHDGVAIHPGGSVVLGQSGAAPVLLLPGTPLACLCAYDLLAARLLRRLAGRPDAMPYRQRELRLARKIASRIGQLEIARVRIDGTSAEPIATAEGRVLATAVQADGFVLVPAHSEGYPQDSRVDVYLYDAFD